MPACLSCGFESDEVFTFDPRSGAKLVHAVPGALEQAIERHDCTVILFPAARLQARGARLQGAVPR